jgi:hypothetical protein
VGHVGGKRGVLDLASRRPTKCSEELMSGGWSRGGAGRKSESSGAKQKSRAARVQARGKWRRAANNVARSGTARRGSSQAQITGAKRDRRHDGRQEERPFAKLTLKPAVTWQGAVAADLGRLKAATAGAAPQSHALPPSTVKGGSLARMRPSGCAPWRRKCNPVRGMMCGRNVSCRQGSRLYPAGLFLIVNGMDATRHAWWRVGTGNSMGWTLRKPLLQFARTGQCVCSWRRVRMKT